MRNRLGDSNNPVPVDPDVDIVDALQRAEMSSRPVMATMVLAAGGVLGALARYSIDRSWPTATGAPDWATLVVNVVGSLLIGVVMVISRHRAVPRLIRLFAAPGLLGGFSTFSGFGESTREMLSDGRIRPRRQLCNHHRRQLAQPASAHQFRCRSPRDPSMIISGPVAVAVGAAVGAPARYFVDRTIQLLHDTRYPWGIMVVNIVGSFILGMIVGAGLAGANTFTGQLLATGLCGTMTTFSTLSYETVRMFENGRRWRAAANLIGSVAFGTAAVAGGFAIGS